MRVGNRARIAWLTVGGILAAGLLASAASANDPLPGFEDLDERWSTRFVRPAIGNVRALVRDRNGHLIVGGRIGNAVGFEDGSRYMLRWDGRRWHPMGSGVNDTVYAVAEHPGGEIWAAGDFTEAGGVPASRVARWNGEAWLPAGPGLDASVRALLITPGGSVYAGGISGGSRGRVMVFDGSGWTQIGSTLNGSVESLGLGPDGSLYAGGFFTARIGVAGPVRAIARFNSDPDIQDWEEVGEGFPACCNTSSPVVHSIGFDPQGRLVVGGVFGVFERPELSSLARLGSGGWEAVGGGIPTSLGKGVFALAFDDAGGLVIGGNMFGPLDELEVSMVARFDGERWSDMDRGVRTSTHRVYALAPAGFGDAMYVGGDFLRVGNAPSGGTNPGSPFQSIARWQSDHWSGLGQGATQVSSTPGELFALALAPGGDVLAAGNFRVLGGAASPGVARWYGDFWARVNQTRGMAGGTATGDAVMADHLGRLVVAGNFHTYDGEPRANIARRGLDGIWEALGEGFGNTVHAVAEDADKVLYAGGVFTSSGETPISRVARFDGARWQQLGAGLNGSVKTLVIGPDGLLYAGGGFTQSGSVVLNRVARWNGSSWQPLGGGMGNGVVERLFFAPDGTLYAGGNFTSAGGQSGVNRIARFDGSNWQPLGDGFNATVYGLAMDPEGRLYAGGQFASSGATPLQRIAWWDGLAWQPLGGGLTLTVGNQFPVVRYLLADDRYLHIGGIFNFAHGRPSSGFARFTFGEIDREEFPEPLPPPVTDIIATSLDVLQAIHSTDGLERLVERKRTFVRLNGYAEGEVPQQTYARLRVQTSAGQVHFIEPLDGDAVLRAQPNTVTNPTGALFELPTDFAFGTITLTGEFNPITTWRDRDPPETDYSNNSISVAAHFEHVPPLRLDIGLVTYSVQTGSGLQTAETDPSEVPPIIDWFERAYPIRSVQLTTRTMAFLPVIGVPTCSLLNSLLIVDRAILNFGGGPSGLGPVLYALISDELGFMRGCSPGARYRVASGPTGPTVIGRNWNTDWDGTWGWDEDGTYGDWYTGHEVGHALGRRHVGFCGAENGDLLYPYPGGRIGPDTGDWYAYGFDRATRQILPSSQWHDYMSYCENQWTSDYTYYRLMNDFQDGVAAEQLRLDALRARQTPAPHLLIRGQIDPDTLEASLQPAILLPEAIDIFFRDDEGDFALILRDASAAELARYKFQPELDEGGSDEPGELRHTEVWLVGELVPWVPGTARIDLELDDVLLASLSPGPGVPTVSIVAPAPGAVLGEDAVTVAWAANDPDGDPLHFVLKYSADDGDTWRVLASDLTTTDIEWPLFDLLPTPAARFRVIASDGVQTATSTSGAVSVPPQPAKLTVVLPTAGAVFSSQQGIPLSANARAMGGAWLDGADLAWHSDLDGELGEGARLTVTGLSPGLHLIQASTSDGASASVPIQVLEHAGLLPVPGDRLVVSPGSVLQFRDSASEALFIDNSNGANPKIPWEAESSEPWLLLERGSGRTPDQVLLVTDVEDLGPGYHTAHLSLRSAWLPGVEERIRVRLLIDESGPGSGMLIFQDRFEP